LVKSRYAGPSSIGSEMSMMTASNLSEVYSRYFRASR